MPIGMGLGVGPRMPGMEMGMGYRSGMFPWRAGMGNLARGTPPPTTQVQAPQFPGATAEGVAQLAEKVAVLLRKARANRGSNVEKAADSPLDDGAKTQYASPDRSQMHIFRQQPAKFAADIGHVGGSTASDPVSRSRFYLLGKLIGGSA